MHAYMIVRIEDKTISNLFPSREDIQPTAFVKIACVLQDMSHGKQYLTDSLHMEFPPINVKL